MLLKIVFILGGGVLQRAMSSVTSNVPKLSVYKEQYKDYPVTRRDNEWNELYRNYRAFLQNYGRKPQRDNPYENHFYSWFEKCVNDFIEGNLSPNREKMYIELHCCPIKI